MSDIKTLNGHNLVDAAATAKLNKVIETVGGDTLTWDGDITGLEVSSNGYCFRVSAAVPAKEDFSGAITITGDYGEGETSMTVPGEELQPEFQDDGFVSLDVFVIVPTDNYSAYDNVFPKSGTYFAVGTKSITISGYTGFAQEKLRPEALPDVAGNHVFYFDILAVLKGKPHYLYHDVECTNPVTAAKFVPIMLDKKDIIVMGSNAGNVVGKSLSLSTTIGHNEDGTTWYGVILFETENNDGTAKVIVAHTAEYVPPTTTES